MGSKQQLRAGIIGLGGIAQSPAPKASHSSLGTALPYSHASAYAFLSEEVELVSVCDVVAAQHDVFKKNWAHTWPNMRYYQDFHEMLNKESLDIVSVCTPDHLHKEAVVAACEAGVPGVLCEKPFATDMDDANAMIQAAKTSGAYLSVEHTRRWRPHWHLAREMVRNGEIGELVYVQETMTGSGNAMLFRNACHGVDLINFFADADPIWVWAELDPDFDGYGRTYKGQSGRDRSLDPGANIYVSYSNGVRGIHIGFQKGVRDLSVLLTGTKGKLEITDRTLTHIHQPDHENPFASPHTFVSKSIALPHTTRGGIPSAIAELAESVRSGTPPELSPASEAVKTVAIMVGALESHDRGGVKFGLSLNGDLPQANLG